MISIDALFKVSYGLYIVGSGNHTEGNAYISNTFFQVTADPPQFATCCSKDNYTIEFIKKYNNFSVSVLHTDTPSDIFGRFGYKSGRDFDKLDGMNIKYGETGAPIIINEAIAFLECKVNQSIDLGTHILFIGDLIQSEILDEGKTPITYLDYRNIRKGFAPKNAPTYIDKSKLQARESKDKSAKYKCAACGYIYDEENEEVKFDDLPDDWLCPICGSDKDDFYKL